MAEELLAELREIALRLDEAAERGGSETEEPLRRVMDAAAELAKAWSGSNLGFHSRVYYAELKPPPPGAHFDSEWGFEGTFQGTTGSWREYEFDQIVAVLYERAGIANLDREAKLARETATRIETASSEVVSVLRAWLVAQRDTLIEELAQEAEAIAPMNERTAQRALTAQGGPKLVRDTTALSQGWQPAPHQVIEARAIAIRSAYQTCAGLARLADRAAHHIERLEASQRSRGQKGLPAGRNVFIGHGRSGAWRELKDFISERLGLPWDEFNRVPVAGVTNIARLSEMLDEAGIAFLVLTAEDEQADGTDRARQNVVHEAGLFQGRLGFARAIVLLEAGCEPFSNIQGLGQIRFPRGNIAACFEEVRRVLEREGFLRSD